MNLRIGGPNFHNSAATKKKRAPRETAEAAMNTTGSRPATPLAMVMTL